MVHLWGGRGIPGQGAGNNSAEALDSAWNQISDILLKLGRAWQAPDRMCQNPVAILFVEPVTAGSMVAKPIEREKSGAVLSCALPSNSPLIASPFRPAVDQFSDCIAR